MKNRISKVLAAAGIASRRHAETLVQAGRVVVNGKPVLLPQTFVDTETDTILLDGKPVRPIEEKFYFALNKPAGTICSAAGPGKKVLDLFSHIDARLFTVGRLDKETTGLILITNDGHFANRVIHPSYGITKEYLAKTGSEITVDHLRTLSKGTRIENTLIKPLAVKKVRKGTVKITVAEGKKHEVRLLLATAGLTVYHLSRIRIGPLTLSTLPLGQHRPLTSHELNHFACQ